MCGWIIVDACMCLCVHLHALACLYISHHTHSFYTHIHHTKHTHQQAVAAAPHLYPELVKLDVANSLLGLVTHENTDVSIAMLGCLAELTDPDVILEADQVRSNLHIYIHTHTH